MESLYLKMNIQLKSCLVFCRLLGHTIWIFSYKATKLCLNNWSIQSRVNIHCKIKKKKLFSCFKMEAIYSAPINLVFISTICMVTIKLCFSKLRPFKKPCTTGNILLFRPYDTSKDLNFFLHKKHTCKDNGDLGVHLVLLSLKALRTSRSLVFWKLL